MEIFKKKTNTDQAQKSYIEILIRDKLCAYLISYDGKSKGMLTKGDVDNFEDDKCFFTKIIQKKSFKISSIEDVRVLSKLILKLKNIKKFKRSKTFDGNHLQVYFSGVKKIDTYGESPDDYSIIINLFDKYLPFKMNYNCNE